MSARWVRALALVAIAASLSLAVPATALAERVWIEGTGEVPLSLGALEQAVTGTVRSQPGAVLARSIVWEYRRPGQEPFDPFSVQFLANGNVLMASRTNEVLEVNRQKRIVWSYTRLGDDPELINVYSAQRLPNGNTLITDRRADFVIEVTPGKQVVWRYGAQPDTYTPGSLYDPFSAVRLPNGNTLIADNRGATRVLEIRSSDYDPAAPDLGYTEESIVWRYGRDNDAGVGAGQLASPRHAVRLASGNTLITDAATQDAVGNRVIEVTPAGDIVWQFGVAGEAGTDETRLNTPSGAQRLANGNTVIIEEDGARMLEVDPAGRIVDWYGNGEMVAVGGELGKARAFDRTPSGTTLIAEQGGQRVIEIGYPSVGTITSRELTLGLPGVKKSIARIEVIADLPLGTSVSLAYSLDGAGWVSGGPVMSLPAGAAAKELRYRITLRTDSAAYTPVVRAVRVTYDVAPADTTAPGGGTTTGGGGTATGTDSRGGAGAQGTISGAKVGGTGGPAVAAGSGVPGVLPGTGRGARSSFARGTLLDVIPLSGPDGIGLGALGSGAGPDAVALGLLLVGVAYLAGMSAGPAATAIRSVNRLARTRLGRSTA